MGVDEVTLSSLAVRQRPPCANTVQRWHTGAVRTDPFRPTFPPCCCAVSIHMAGWAVNRERQHLPNPPRLLCSVVQILAPPLPPIASLPTLSQTPWSPCQPLSLSLLRLLGSPTECRNLLLQGLNKSSYTYPVSLS